VLEVRETIPNQYFQFLPSFKIFSKIVKTILKFFNKMNLGLIMPHIM